MAWIEDRKRTDGGTSAHVRWRLGGVRSGQVQIETFSAGSDAQNRARAEGFKQMVDAAGQYWPEGWVKGEGFVRPREGNRYEAAPSFAVVGEEYVRQIVELSPGQRKRYLFRSAPSSRSRCAACGSSSARLTPSPNVTSRRG